MAAYTQQELYDLWARTVPEELIAGIEASGDDRMFKAVMAVAARVSSACEGQRLGQYVATATAGYRSQGTLRVSRSLAGGASTILAGAQFVTPSLVRIRTTATAVLPVGVGMVDVAAEGAVSGLSGNLDSGDALSFYEASFVGEDCGQHLTAVALGAFTQGTDAQLESLGRDRGAVRQTAETEQQYRERLRRLPDTISKPGIERTVRRMIQRLTGQVRPTVVVVEHYAVGAVCDLDPFDSIEGPEDQKGNPPGSLLFLSSEDARRSFTVYISPLPEIPEGLVADVGAADVYAVDVLAPASYNAYQRVYEAVHAAKGGGVRFYLALTIDWPSYAYGYDPYTGYYDYDNVYDYPE